MPEVANIGVNTAFISLAELKQKDDIIQILRDSRDTLTVNNAVLESKLATLQESKTVIVKTQNRWGADNSTGNVEIDTIKTQIRSEIETEVGEELITLRAKAKHHAATIKQLEEEYALNRAILEKENDMALERKDFSVKEHLNNIETANENLKKNAEKHIEDLKVNHEKLVVDMTNQLHELNDRLLDKSEQQKIENDNKAVRTLLATMTYKFETLTQGNWITRFTNRILFNSAKFYNNIEKTLDDLYWNSRSSVPSIEVLPKFMNKYATKKIISDRIVTEEVEGYSYNRNVYNDITKKYILVKYEI